MWGYSICIWNLLKIEENVRIRHLHLEFVKNRGKCADLAFAFGICCTLVIGHQHWWAPHAPVVWD